ncbi:MAG TPA: hypothetical protein VML19_22520 [Verrucomicrobiae bacterium]|nr:hypothetical protein [Verrucomicrobiae bacterium]
MNQADFALAVHACLPRRPTRNTPDVRRYDEYSSAEVIAVELFRKDFERRCSGSQTLFITQRDYLTTRSNSPGIQFLLTMMQEYFRNWVSPNNPRREGGFRKPDGMAIATRGRQVCVELLEVKPFHDEADGHNQMQDMLRRLRAGINDFLATQSNRGRFGAGDFQFAASEWRPQPDEMVCPLLNPASGPDLTWGCFDAMRHRPTVGGVLLYELHSLSFASAVNLSRSIPPAISGRIRAACDAGGWSNSSAGASWQGAYCVNHPADVQALRALAAGNCADLAAALALVLSQSTRAHAAAAAGGQRGLTQSSAPLTVHAGGLTALEPAICEAILLACAISGH